ncbi:MAG: DUF4197 domain-containing protein [Chlorobi bacterium]|nr:DUF4197 domain-containing protein [Chlorobiota bacterium]
MKKPLLFLVVIVTIFTSCEQLNTIIDETDTNELTESEIVEGLKTALIVGTDTSTTILSVINGYYGNPLYKIPLPEEAEEVKANINAIINAVPVVSDYLDLDQQFENVVLSINRAAESAAKEASPIFKNAITSLSISDGLTILSGSNPLDSVQAASFDSTAATGYFKSATSASLTQIYGGKIDATLDKDLGLGFSANDAWTVLRTNYNSAVETINNSLVLNTAVTLAGYELNVIETESIGEFCTKKAMDGLFLRVGEEEKKIRNNPLEWAMTAVGNILEKVFGWINENGGNTNK